MPSLRTTRLQYHRHRAGANRTFLDTVKTAPELLARHYTQAGMIAESVPCWLRAGERALHASANPEAIAHLTTGLDLLAGLPAARSAPDRSCNSLGAGPRLHGHPRLRGARGRGLLRARAGAVSRTWRHAAARPRPARPVDLSHRAGAARQCLRARQVSTPAWGCDQRRRATAPGQHGGGLVALLHGRAGAGARASRAGPRAVRPRAPQLPRLYLRRQPGHFGAERPGPSAVAARP